MLLFRLVIAASLLTLAAGTAFGQSAHAAAARVSAPCDTDAPYVQSQKKTLGGGAWMEHLSVEQRGLAEQILSDARPRLHELRQQLRFKMSEIKTFVYGRGTDPDVLPRLGQELQTLRNALYAELRTLEARLASEAGVPAPIYSGRGCAELGKPEASH